MKVPAPSSELATRPDAVQFSKTVSESDICLFAGVSGDFAPIHVDAEYASNTPMGERVAHGVLLMAFMSTAATAWCAKADEDTLSYGYERVRFIKPVRIGDTVTITYAKDSEICEENRIVAAVEAHNQRGELVGVTSHILWRLPDQV